ncbi:hypothetical protein [Streptomyces sp. NPDC058045]|uniref:hypothetical protein n=1 Tax=Streptomyces sp. NPDC058045 TaxID=3346311 RepID=UPI0036F0E6F9
MARAPKRTRPTYHPAGHDAALRGALQDLRAGRWLAMRDLLNASAGGRQWTQRTQVLAAAAAGSDLVQAWRTDEPNNPVAAVMHARVEVERALRAHREGHQRLREPWLRAWEACRQAAFAAPDDPVPWVCLLALARLDEAQEWDEHRVAPPEPMLPPGPWGLLAEADKRDPQNREAYHRMLQFMFGRRNGGRLSEAINFTQWAASSATLGSSLHLLPLYVRVERYRRQDGRDAALDLHWVAEDATREATVALERWFGYTPPAEASLLDLSHLAHALWGSHQFTAGARVFSALDPYYVAVPWTHRVAPALADESPGTAALDLFVQARARCDAAERSARGG